MAIAAPPRASQAARSVVRPEVALGALQDRLRAAQRRVVRQRLAIGACVLAAASGLLVAMVAAADFYWELAAVWRGAALLALVGGFVAAAVWGYRRWIAPYSLARTAEDAEELVTQFGQRLRTTLDYHAQSPRPAQASASLLDALHDETYQVVQQADWNGVVNGRPLVRASLAAGLVVACWLVALVALPEFRTAAGRALLVPWQFTTVVYSPQTTTVRHGESVTINAQISGRPVSTAQLRYRENTPDAGWTTVDLVPAIDDESSRADHLLGKFSATLADLQHDTQFEVLAGPRALPPGSIQVLQPLLLEKSQARIVPPSYTSKKEETVESLDLKVLEGSTVELRLQFNRAPAEAMLTRLETNADSANSEGEKSAANQAEPDPNAGSLPLVIEESLARITLGDLRQGATFALSAKAADGMALEPARLSIRVQLDGKPQVRFIAPPEELVVTPLAEIEMTVEASDDQGLFKMGIAYQINGGEWHTLFEEDASGSTEPVRPSAVLMLEEHALSHQDGVTYYAFAEDNYFGQPRRTATPLRFIDIRPFRREFQVVQSEGGGACNGCSVTLEELIARQRQVLGLAFAAQERQPVTKALLEPIADQQADLIKKAEEFVEGIEERGASLPAVDEAVEHMAGADESLAAKNLAAAVANQEKALAALIRARENMRQILKQSNSPSASACRKFDREQQQKLRMPEQKKKKDEQQRLAENRAKLEDLAQRERKWSQQTQSACQNPGSKSSSSSGSKPSSSPSPSSPSESSAKEGSPQPPASPQEPGESPPILSPEELAKAQEKMLAELAELQGQLDKLSQAGEGAKKQGQEAAESMQQGLADVQKRDGESAAKAGERSAEQLEQLSAHLASMGSRDFGQRLDQAQQLAQKLAARQAALEKELAKDQTAKSGNGSFNPEPTATADKGKAPSDSKEESTGGNGNQESARQERALAAQTDLLGDLLSALERDASGEKGGIRQKLADAQAENPPREIGAQMRQAADDLAENRPGPAGRGVAQARERLDELGRSLTAARSEYAQPKLEELMALEEELARLMQQMKRAKEQGNKQAGEAAQQKWREIEPKLEAQAGGDRRLAEALRNIKAGPRADAKEGQVSPAEQQAKSGGSPPQSGALLKAAPYREGGDQMPEGFGSWLELGDFSGVREVAKALQTKIQEAIVHGALMDSDQGVPPQYKGLVDKYYRALSDDLR